MEYDYDITKLRKLADDFANEYADAIIYEDKYATGKLANSVRSTIELDDKIISVSIIADEEWKYVEYGRKPGKMPPIDAILSWVKVKGLPRSNSAPKKGGKLPTQEQLAYAISNNIKKYGIKETRIFENLYQKTDFYGKVQNTIAELVQDAIMKKIDNDFKNFQAKI